MRGWNTGDEATNRNLALIEQLSVDHDQLHGPDHFLDLVRAVIGVEKMLPEAVRKHFHLPFLFVGAGPYDWDQHRLRDRTIELRKALADGIAAVRSDPGLNSGSAVSKSDRPRTRAEQIETALRAYRERRGEAELQALRVAVSGTRLDYKFAQLERWLKRKRPSPGGRSIEYEIACVLGDIGRYASDYAHEPATDFESS
jgi:hypothetical protein